MEHIKTIEDAKRCKGTEEKIQEKRPIHPAIRPLQAVEYPAELRGTVNLASEVLFAQSIS
jgi:hypothetical protein